MTLLIVDDNSQVRRLIRSLVEDLAEQCYEWPDGAGAVVMFARHRPDWVLLDIEMKELDGLSTLRQLRAAFPSARVLIVTQHDDPRLRALAYEAGACGYVVKENLLQLRQLLVN